MRITNSALQNMVMEIYDAAQGDVLLVEWMDNHTWDIIGNIRQNKPGILGEVSSRYTEYTRHTPVPAIVNGRLNRDLQDYEKGGEVLASFVAERLGLKSNKNEVFSKYGSIRLTIEEPYIMMRSPGTAAAGYYFGEPPDRLLGGASAVLLPTRYK